MCQVDLQAIIGSYTAVATGLESESARVSSLDGGYNINIISLHNDYLR